MNEINTGEERLRAEIADLKRRLEEQKKAGEARASKPSPVTLVLLALIAVGLIIGGFLAGNAPRQRRETMLAAEAKSASEALPVVTVVKVARSDPKTQLSLPGSIQAITEAPVLARASGYVKRRLVDIGDAVTEGQTLAEIEAPEVDQQIRQATAAIAQANSNEQQAEAALKQGQTNENLARVNAGRWRNMFEKKVVSSQENDTYQAQWAAQQANVEALGKAIAAAKSNVAVTQANLDRLNQLKSYQTVRAPFAGVVTLRNIDTGALVNEGATLLFRVAQTGRLRTFVNIPQSEAGIRAEGAGGGAHASRSARPRIQRRCGAHLRRARSGHAHAAGRNPVGKPEPRSYAGNVRTGRSDHRADFPIPDDPRRHFGCARRRPAGGGGKRRTGALHSHSIRARLRRPPGSALGTPGGSADCGESERLGARGSPGEAGAAGRAGGEEVAMRAPNLSKSAICLLLAAWLAVPGFGQNPLGTPSDQANSGPPVSFRNSQRLRDLIRAGNLYLTLQDALALAIENNLAVEVQRYGLAAGNTEALRATGGGTLRGLNYTLSEVPAGVGGPLSPLVTAAAAGGRAVSGASVGANALETNLLSEPQTNLSVQGTVPQSTGTPVPILDRSLTGQFNWTHQTAPQTNYNAYLANALVTNTTLGNAGIQQGFATGAQVGLSFNNSRYWVNSPAYQYNPYTGSSLALTATQPLLRGFGPTLNRRYIRIAGNEQRIASLLFRQQLTATVYGVIRLYTDFVALSEDQKVKQEGVSLAEKLYADVKAQVDEGTVAPIELTRANAQVFSTRQDLITATGLRDEEEAVLKSVLTRTGNEDPEVRAAHIVAVDALSVPEKDEVRPIPDLIQDALGDRPDLGQARLQIENQKIGLEGARSATLPQVDLVGVLQNNGMAGPANPLSANPGVAWAAGYGGVLDQIFTRKNPTYGVGLQVNLPIHNHIAEADLARDELQVKQSEIRQRQLENQARLEVEDALIAIGRARASYEAATQARKLQEESLAAEQVKFDNGNSTPFFIIQYQSMVAQARSTEVVAKSSYVKARAGLARAAGSILDDNRISFEAAVKGKMQ